MKNNNHITKSPLENVAVHLPTQEKHDEFLRALENSEINYRWDDLDDSKPTDNNRWHEKKEKFNLLFGYGGRKSNILTFCGTGHFQKVISFKEAMKRLKTPIKEKTEKTFTQEEVKNLVSDAFTSGLNFGLSIKNDR
jgi:hypothetical protein